MQTGTGIWSNELSIWRLLCLKCSEQYKSRRTTGTILLKLTKYGQVYEMPLNASCMNGIIQEPQKHKVWKIHQLWQRPTFSPVGSKVLLCAIPYHRVKIRKHTTTCHFCSIVCVIQLVWSVQKLSPPPPIHTMHLDIIKVLHQLMHKFFKRSIKIYIKTAPTCFGVITILTERTIWAC
jgi:hypothetical protein